MISEIFQSARWNWHPTTTGAVWAIIIAEFHRIPARVCSLSSCQLLYSLSLFKSLPCSHLTVCCKLSSTDLVSICIDWVSWWAMVETPSWASMSRGRRGAVVLRGFGYNVVNAKKGRLDLCSGGGLCMGQEWDTSVHPPWGNNWCWLPSLTVDGPRRQNK